MPLGAVLCGASRHCADAVILYAGVCLAARGRHCPAGNASFTSVRQGCLARDLRDTRSKAAEREALENQLESTEDVWIASN